MYFSVRKLVSAYSIKNTKCFCRFYQTDNVFGYKKKPLNEFNVSQKVLEKRCESSNLYRLVSAYRKYGHKYAKVNPVCLGKTNLNDLELDIRKYGFKNTDEVIYTESIVNGIEESTIPLSELVKFLDKVYCNYTSAEFEYLETEEEREWFASELETSLNWKIDANQKKEILKDLIKSEAFDNFLAKKFSGVKRYGGEGAESMMTVLSELFQSAAKDSLEHIVLAMPHRGRLNLLTGLLNYPPTQIFHKLKGNADFPEKYQCSGDVLSHLISSADLIYPDDSSVHVSLIYNPSHLEAVNPVSMGKTRAKQLALKDGDYGTHNVWSDKVLNIQVHGDAAIIGQGVNQECLELSGVPHFEIGGSIHLVVNNQVGFTTPSDRGRSSRYCTDLAKIISAPVLHVNGDHPEEVYKATRIAYQYQRKFRKDIFIDLNCFRRWGHNEMDDPTFTNPALYSIIHSKRSVPQLYKAKLEEERVISEQECEEVYNEHFDWLNEELKAVDQWEPYDPYFKDHWKDITQAEEAVTTWDTGINVNHMSFIGQKSVNVPDNFKIHPTILRGHVTNRLSKIANGQEIDWSTAEALALGSLLLEGHNVRISGQDIGRGTFSQRHAMLVDQQSNNIFIPLNNMHPNQTTFLELANSILSEEAVLGYEYGMSIENPNNIIIWEAQFGDFFNGAQIIFDTFISSGEAKWITQSGLTVLLPHGYDGAGPEHSSARIERFLQMTDSKEDKVDGETVNMQVCHPSTPAQYFHLLRRQMIRPFRKPLILFTPKTLLRSADCVSNFTDMEKGTHFKPIIGDNKVVPAKVQRVLLTSGKHYYTLDQERGTIGVDDTAILRIESFCPFPTLELIKELSIYPNSKVFIWCQEEPQNMGAWAFIKRRFENLIGRPVN
ncbi:probable 2-oxoglutarate dehydrogenase E1 component DHKTD1 homolog, mitochondrial isoform X2 [Sitophilus oryzae]|uniref:Probable 2-oxoglutarate dehydrogenase E1 component DHKTD1 homolog, mitochondrial isoform X2 n=1 Tax=Sitophilus oryzae TaxID=7048 RepID=A0A6J2XTU4_SITOR|nr:probable 2-oxoglutarate dehydrogenase E1 component DHKTD1 homolog, mitochondrial isoform X2 [Sitophilus oryzae]